MKKGLYLVVDSMDFENPGGIEKKIQEQIDLFRTAGFDMSIYRLKKISRNGKYTYWSMQNLPIDLREYSLIYFRKCTVIDLFFVSYLKKIRSSNSRIKIVMELPSYPYDGEFGNGIRSKVALFVDHIFRKKLVGVIDMLAITGEGKPNVWGLKAVYFNNGIDVNRIKIKSQPYHKLNEQIVISCVAQFSPWHGYERLLKGLKMYYGAGGDKDIKILMVGEGSELEKYKRYVAENELDTRIEFLGKKTDEELDEVLDNTDIGCCSLGRYKTNNFLSGELKSREYMARGILMLTGCDIDVLRTVEYPYEIKFPNNDSVINIEHILAYYEKMVVGSESCLSQEIRSMSIELVDFSKTFATVLNAVEVL